MRGEKVVTLFVGLLFSAGAMADDCERFKLHGVHLRDTGTEIRELHGKPSRARGGQRPAWDGFEVGSTELIVTYDSGRQDRKAASLEMRVPHSIVPYQNVMDEMTEHFGPHSWSEIAPEPELGQLIMIWESEACDIHVAVLHLRTKSRAYRGSSLVVRMRPLTSANVGREASTGAFN